MNKIKEIIIGTNNLGKYKEISNLLPKNIKKHSPKTFNLSSPKETGKTFAKNSLIKASFFCKKTNFICLSDDSGLEIDILKGQPGIYSSRWSGKKNNFNLAIKKIFKKLSHIKKEDWGKNNSAKFTCCLTLFWPSGRKYTSKGVINGKISFKKKGKNGFGYDPIFIPHGFKTTFGEMTAKKKMSMDHRFIAFSKIKNFFY